MRTAFKPARVSRCAGILPLALLLLLPAAEAHAFADGDSPPAALAETIFIPPAPRPAAMSFHLRFTREHTFSSAERKCLATAIYFEARGESAGGQAAVAQVILNRVRSKAYPDTICGVVYQGKNRRSGCQFSFTCDGKSDAIREKTAWTRAEKIADDVAAGRARTTTVALATHYHATYVSPYWAPSMRRLTRIGQHIFYDGA